MVCKVMLNSDSESRTDSDNEDDMTVSWFDLKAMGLNMQIS